MGASDGAMTGASEDGAAGSSTRSVAEHIRSVMPDLTPSERSIARALLAAYPTLGLDTVASLAAHAKVSAPTVVRFARHLGFDGFRSLQRALREELAVKNQSNLSQAEARGGERTTFDHARDAYLTGITSTFADNDPAELEAVVGLLADEGRPLLAVGGAYSGAVTRTLIAQLAPVRRNARVLEPHVILSSTEMADAADRGVLVVADVRRYDPELAKLAEAAHGQGITVVLLTDPWLSPISAFAERLLTASVKAAGPSDTLVPMLALVEGVCELVVEARGKYGLERLQRVEQLRSHLA
ncbi:MULTISPECIES: MurR/RpiR family transcriptional regulator [Helcobacillus]|uniref:DNA-binding MurR/RpiR family transcriptional regulator n=1 Tax=Helcobacillus massiliensis TaxID=521392 RepID=A0A839R2Q3_9MICO|nr:MULTISPECIES: MurR/RpiR family transcriptional regulator [Helcobacillus]MBB3023326.1 DNA-binding MurR/RpiR family transcriptional regulator [Helcobacillus massiliensis]MCG7426698.1 MurR/RpiR family transcriptional regulator [Helcobacillus sp. ACRRO]MDK7742399.1 MurR/RpiR family transcriptional regulator [Helcobacillus massiliensis]WOO92514.1 MurR/RpiR family transcriptional regulator [Helcobacillus massiliensis]